MDEHYEADSRRFKVQSPINIVTLSGLGWQVLRPGNFIKVFISLDWVRVVRPQETRWRKCSVE